MDAPRSAKYFITIKNIRKNSHKHIKCEKFTIGAQNRKTGVIQGFGVPQNLMVFNDSQEATSMSSKILKIAAVMEKTGLPRTTLYMRIAANEFPRPISLGARAVGWLESEIDAWLESRARGTAKQRATASTAKG